VCELLVQVTDVLTPVLCQACPATPRVPFPSTTTSTALHAVGLALPHP
jgi:hypothetical protein